MAGGSFFSRVFAHISRSSAKLPGSALKLKSSPQLPQPWTRILTVPSPSRHRKSTAVSFSPRSTMQLPCLTPASFQVRPPWLIYIELGAAQKLAPKYASESERGARAVYLKVGLQQVSALDLKALVINSVLEFDKGAAGRTIRLLRRERGLSQEVLSGFAGIARTHLTMIETGTKQANFETIWRIALALDLRPSQLVEQIERECLAPGSTEADAKK